MSSSTNKLESPAVIAVISNELLKSSYNLSVMEHRIVKSFTASIGYSDVLSEDTPYSMKLMDFAHFWGLNGCDVRKDIKVSVNTLFKREITIKTAEGHGKIHWLQKFWYSNADDSFYLYWNKDVIRHISLLRERFAKLNLDDLVGLRSSYSIRMYELLITAVGENSYKNPSWSPEELMELLDVPDSYREYKIFKMRVLNVIWKELKENVVKFKDLEMELEVGNRKWNRKVERIGWRRVGVGNKYREVTSL